MKKEQRVKLAYYIDWTLTFDTLHPNFAYKSRTSLTGFQPSNLSLFSLSLSFLFFLSIFFFSTLKFILIFFGDFILNFGIAVCVFSSIAANTILPLSLFVSFFLFLFFSFFFTFAICTLLSRYLSPGLPFPLLKKY